MTAVEVAVYTPDGATLVAVVPRRQDVRWQDELNGTGAGQFALHLDDALVLSTPAVLTPFSIVKVKPAGAADYVYAWQLEDLDPVQVSADERAGRMVTVSGRQVRSLLESAMVMASTESRAFDFSSPVGSWYVSADWVVPVGVRQDSDPTARAGWPSKWPDPAAQWIWSTDPTTTSPAERNWFRGSFTLTAPTTVKLWCAADNVMDVRVNGEPVITTDPTDLFSWRDDDPSTYVATLPAGTHLVAAAVDNSAAASLNPGAFLCVVGTPTPKGDLDTVLLRTNTTDWLVHAAANPPGWPAAMILTTLLTEAQADGYIPHVSWDFTETTDSDGAAWTDRQDLLIPTGTDLLAVSNMWAGSVYDITMTPDLVLHARHREGVDRTATVDLGSDVTDVRGKLDYAPLRNVLRASYPGGWVRATDAASVALYGPRAAGLSLGDAGSSTQAQQDAAAALVDLAAPAVTASVSTTSLLGPQAFTAYALGDTVTAPAAGGGSTPSRVMSITAEENDNRIDWTTELYPET